MQKRYPRAALAIPLALAAIQADAAFTSVATLEGVVHSTMVWGDYDNDGDLDVFIAGKNTGGKHAIIYRNDGGNTFTSVASLTGVDYAAAAWGDYDNDGDLDVLLTGYDGAAEIAILYENKGSDTFTSSTATSLRGAQYAAVAWGDYDNDGDLDLVIAGANWTAGGNTYSTILYRNDGSGVFTSVTTLQAVYLPSVSWGDYDNDGDLDLLLTGTKSSDYAIVYRNDGSDTFTSVATLQPVQIGSAAWGDYDGDGLLDILLTGYHSGSYTVVYHNDGSDTFSPAVTTLQGYGFSSAAWGDYDNDGDLDILVEGDTTGSSAASTRIYRNDGSGTFTSVTDLQNTEYGAVAWGDYDGDGDLDIMVSGDDGSGGNHAIIYQASGNGANTAPAAPSGLTAAVGSSSTLLKWDQASDSETAAAGLSYNLCLGTASGQCDRLDPMANTATGARRLPARGAVQTYGTGAGKAWLVTGLTPCGDYYWRVQSIDAGFKGSAFSSEAHFNNCSGTAVTLTHLAALRGKGRAAISWRTESEPDNVGFHIWRGFKKNGQFIRLTDELIPAQGDASQGAEYRFVDKGVRPGNAYFYELEAVDGNGKSELYGPVRAGK